MIISHKHKFIFIKPTKVAGTSIELMLSKFCGESDVITPFIHEPNSNVRSDNGAKEPRNFMRKKPLARYTLGDLKYCLKNFSPKNEIVFTEHDSAEKIKKIVGEEVWNSYFKISIVRNPWDQLVSWFEWRRYRLNEEDDDPVASFKEKIFDNNYNVSSLWDRISINNTIDLDFVIKFENLQEDFNVLMNMLSLENNAVVPKTKDGIRKVKDYKPYYDEFMKEFVYRKNKKLIECFDYQF